MDERRRSALRRPVSPTARLATLCTNGDLADARIEVVPGVHLCRGCFDRLQQDRAALAARVLEMAA
jgi:hypothetical protein